MRLAVCVVYVVSPGSEWLLRLHLRKIAENTGRPFTLFAAMPRVSDEARAILESVPNLEVPDVPPTEERGSAEHGHYLDALVARAEAEGFSHFATFDADSFPVAPDWVERLAGQLDDRHPFAAVLRAENGDNVLPHPSGMLCSMAFYRATRPIFFPGNNAVVEAYAESHGQGFDTGIGYAFACAQAGLDWVPLTRSNAHDDHRLMAGIYGDAIFHLGASSRYPLFRFDFQTNAFRRTMHGVRNATLGRPLYRQVEKRVVRANRRIQDAICSAVEHDADAYIAHLRGQSA